MKAFAYQQTSDRTLYSDHPAEVYVLQFDLASAIHGGIGSVTTPNYNGLLALIKEQRAQGTKVVTSRLPLGTRSIDNKVIKDDIVEPVEIHTMNTPLDRVA
tara:strand:- start:242 stop:544 length:303 start_codon:yes stop_codon:yes gene_type:complete